MTGATSYATNTEDLSVARSNKNSKKPKHESLKSYQQDVLGIDHTTSKAENIGKSLDKESVQGVDTVSVEKEDDTRVPLSDCATIIALNKNNIKEVDEEAREEARRMGLPTPAELMSQGFGQPSKDHSFTQEASGETILFQFVKVGSVYLDKEDIASFRATHPLVDHLYKMMIEYQSVDFSELREYDLNYDSQEEIPKERIRLFMACSFHFDLSVANVMRYVGKNYTGGYRNVEESVSKMRGLVDDDLLTLYARVMTLGAPSHFVAESTRKNTLLHWRKNNHPSIMANLPQTLKAMNKLEKHKFVILLRSWIARFVPHIFFTPHHILRKDDKDRLICDSSRRFTPTSVPLNMMTSTRHGVELSCDYGGVLMRILIRVWRLRTMYPLQDIILDANDVKSCFRQIKHHPEVMGAFSYVIAETLYLSCGLTMGSDFSPAVWEVCRRLAEQLATSLFADDSLVPKH